MNYLDYLGCIQAIKSYISINNIHIKDGKYNQRTKTLQIISDVKKGSRIYYDILLEKMLVYDISTFVKWEQKLNIIVHWENTLKQVRKIKEVKLKWFQLRLCHNILVTNCILKKMGISERDMCTFCENEKDSVQHYLWYCTFSQCFWTQLENVLKDKCEQCQRVKFNIELVLFGNDDVTKTDDQFDHIILLAKYFLYKNKIKKTKPEIKNFLHELKIQYETEKYMYSLEMKYTEFCRQWYPYEKLLETDV